MQLIFEGEQIVGFQALARDITAVKQAQEALQIARDQALEASRAKTQLLSKVSHELHTPLGGILGYAELLQGNTFGKLSQRQNKAVSEIVDSAEYLTNMVNELLDEAQLRSSTAMLIVKKFSPFKLIQAAISGLDILAQKKGLSFSVQIDPDLPQEIYGDDRRIRQIIINLVGNAIKFTKEGSAPARHKAGRKSLGDPGDRYRRWHSERGEIPSIRTVPPGEFICHAITAAWAWGYPLQNNSWT